MRVLTVRQPWAWAIVHGGKDVENRPRNIAGTYRGPVAIHAGQAWDDAVTWNSAWATLLAAMKADGSDPFDAPWQTQRGSIIGVVDLVDVHDPTDRLFGLTGCQGQCTPWADEGLFHLVLANPRSLATPIPYRGALGLRRPDEATIARIMEALA